MPAPRITGGPTTKVKVSKSTIKQLWGCFAKYKKSVIIALIVAMIAGGINTCAIYLNGHLYDQWINNSAADWSKTLIAFIFTCVGLLICYFISSGFSWLANFLILKTAERGSYHIRSSVFKKLQKLPIKYFDVTPSGDIISRTANDIDNISMTISQYVGNCVFWVCSIISLLLLMFLINWALSLTILIVYPVVAIVNVFIIGKLRPYFAKQQKSLGELNGFVEEYVSGTKIISLFQMEDKTMERFNNANEKLTKNSLVANATANMMMPLNMFFNNISFVVMAALGIYSVMQGWISKDWGVVHFDKAASLLIIYTMFARNLTNPINQLFSTFSQFMLFIASSDRVFEILKQPEEKDPENAVLLDKSKVVGKVQAQHMDFSYVPDKPILKDINFIAKPGTITALVGPTGAGKTTIVNLITKFYDINDGKLLVDDQSIKNIERNSLRENITMVLQDTYLFGTTIYENIRYGRLNATKADIIKAAKLANCHDFITKLPKGYNTILSDNGDNLSQGQRQLLAIARAFLADSKIVILDEATSSIDTKTEIQIQTAMEKLIKNRTTFMIAHRLSTIKNADNILVIDHGKIMEHGKHKELINKKGFYYKLYMSQFRGNQI